MRRTVLVVFSIAVLGPVACARAQSGGVIGLSPDGSCTGASGKGPCRVSLALGVPKTLYIVSLPDIAHTDGGVFGAEFRVTGTPASGLMLTVHPNPAASFVVGFPFSNEALPEGERGGTRMGFGTCEAPNPNGVVLLYRVTALLLDDRTEVVFRTEAMDPPGNPNFDCPLLVACDAPTFTTLCAEGGVVALDVPTSVESRPWSRIKQLFR